MPGANAGAGPFAAPAAPAAYADGTGSGGYPAQPPTAAESGTGARRAGTGAFAAPFSEPGTGGFRIAGALRTPSTPGKQGDQGDQGDKGGADAGNAAEADWQQADGRQGPGSVHVVTGVPVRPNAAPNPEPNFRQASQFDVFTPIPREDTDNRQVAGTMPYAQPYPDYQRSEYDRSGIEPTQAYSYGDGLPPAGLEDPADQGNSRDQVNIEQGDGGYDNGTADGGEDHNGLPRRVRQANLAPQLRASAAGAGPTGPVSVPPAKPESLTVMRNTLSAMQRGWQQGRSEVTRDAEKED